MSCFGELQPYQTINWKFDRNNSPRVTALISICTIKSYYNYKLSVCFFNLSSKLRKKTFTSGNSHYYFGWQLHFFPTLNPARLLANNFLFWKLVLGADYQKRERKVWGLLLQNKLYSKLEQLQLFWQKKTAHNIPERKPK